jgi:toxin-antitoxin system PIN domain toxin
VSDFPDVNVWVAAGAPDHRAHARALRFWRDEAREELLFCRVTSLALLRLLTASAPTGGRPLTVPDAWSAYRSLRAVPGVGFAAEPPGCESVLEGWLTAGLVTPRLWTDAYLAAFAVAGGFRLVTFDRDFARFPGLDLLLLES